MSIHCSKCPLLHQSIPAMSTHHEACDSAAFALWISNNARLDSSLVISEANQWNRCRIQAVPGYKSHDLPLYRVCREPLNYLQHKSILRFLGPSVLSQQSVRVLCARLGFRRLSSWILLSFLVTIMSLLLNLYPIAPQTINDCRPEWNLNWMQSRRCLSPFLRQILSLRRIRVLNVDSSVYIPFRQKAFFFRWYLSANSSRVCLTFGDNHSLSSGVCVW